eukprot:1118761-Amphidinium_carterae.1
MDLEGELQDVPMGESTPIKTLDLAGATQPPPSKVCRGEFQISTPTTSPRHETICVDPVNGDVAVFERLVTTVHCNQSGRLAELKSQTKKMTAQKPKARTTERLSTSLCLRPVKATLHLAAGALKQRDPALDTMLGDAQKLEYNVVEHTKRYQYAESEARISNERLYMSKLKDEVCTEHQKIEQRAKEWVATELGSSQRAMSTRQEVLQKELNQQVAQVSTAQSQNGRLQTELQSEVSITNALREKLNQGSSTAAQQQELNGEVSILRAQLAEQESVIISQDGCHATVSHELAAQTITRLFATPNDETSSLAQQASRGRAQISRNTRGGYHSLFDSTPPCGGDPDHPASSKICRGGILSVNKNDGHDNHDATPLKCCACYGFQRMVMTKCSQCEHHPCPDHIMRNEHRMALCPCCQDPADQEVLQALHQEHLQNFLCTPEVLTPRPPRMPGGNPFPVMLHLRVLLVTEGGQGRRTARESELTELRTLHRDFGRETQQGSTTFGQPFEQSNIKPLHGQSVTQSTVEPMGQPMRLPLTPKKEEQAQMHTMPQVPVLPEYTQSPLLFTTCCDQGLATLTSDT